MKWKPETDKAWVSWVAIGFGQTLYLCYVPNFLGPVGFVWGAGHTSGRKQRFDVFGSYVVPPARRAGVRTKINDTIFQHFNVITTDAGTGEGGLAFLKASGYRKILATHSYVLQKPKFRKR